MKFRIAIAAILGVVIFVGIGVAYGLTAVYCDQSFPGDHSPLVCADTQPGASGLTKFAMNFVEWILLLGLPALVAYLYARFGWPKKPQPKNR